MATVTITHVLTRTVTASAASASAFGSASSTQRATSQAGVFDHHDPTVYDPKNPIIVFIIQAGIILIFCRLLHWPLSKIRQPRVIAEVIGGILLGPSVMGRIPNFTQTIFPAASMPNLTLAANLGLVLFLFLVGLEVDLRYLVRHWRVALTVGCAGMALPFGLGCAISWGLYDTFRDEPGLVPIDFPIYMLFIGLAMAITAFPVLCRILTDLKLLSTPVGVIVLAAGVGNDVVGWILLALCVALVNTGHGIVALYVLLVCFGFVLFLVFAVRPPFMWLLRRTRSIEDGPSQSTIALTLLIALASAFFTGIIGVHPIFGAFLAGLICPHEGGFAIKVTEKIEDLVSTLFLPLYFALSGLSTDLGLLNTGITWGYVVAVIVVAFASKFISGSGAARLNGHVWRECFTIGSLMSCKGLVELIVLNIGLQAKILSTRTFTIFVVMALATTFATTPLVSFLYPPWYQQKIEAWKRGEIDWDTGTRRRTEDGNSQDVMDVEKLEAPPIHNILMYLRLDSLPSTLVLVSCLGQTTGSDTSGATPAHITAHGLRLLPLETERDSSVMKVSEVEDYTLHDPVVNTFLALGVLHGVPTSGEAGIAPEAFYATALANKAQEIVSDLLLLPWPESGSMSEVNTVISAEMRSRWAGSPFNMFVRDAFDAAAKTCHVGVMVSTSLGSPSRLLQWGGLEDILVPFSGTSDDKVAVRLAFQLASNRITSIKVLNIETHDEMPATVTDVSGSKIVDASSTTSIVSFDKRQHFLEALRSTLTPEVAKRVMITSVDGSGTDGLSPDAVVSAIFANSQTQSTLFLVGRNANSFGPRDLHRSTSASIRESAGPGPSCLGALANSILSRQAKYGRAKEAIGQSQASMIVLQARRPK